MGLPIVTFSRLIDRKHLRGSPAGAAWRVPATIVLLALVLPVLLTAAVVTLPVLLSVALAFGVRRAWQWQAQRQRARIDR